jgi:hypothetical protein
VVKSSRLSIHSALVAGKLHPAHETPAPIGKLGSFAPTYDAGIYDWVVRDDDGPRLTWLELIGSAPVALQHGSGAEC